MTEGNKLKISTRASFNDKSALNNLLKGMDKSVVASFSPKQLSALNNALNNEKSNAKNIRAWRTHRLDFRPTLALPFIPWSFYIVFLFDVNRRSLSTPEKFIASAMFLLIIFMMGLTMFGLIFLVLYLFKSWLGIDIFPESSLGIWDEFKNLFD